MPSQSLEHWIPKQGSLVGCMVGEPVGERVGATVGAAVGAAVGVNATQLSGSYTEDSKEWYSRALVVASSLQRPMSESQPQK